MTFNSQFLVMISVRKAFILMIRMLVLFFHDAASRLYTDTRLLVGLIWMSGQPDAETCTWQPILIRQRHSCRRRDSIPQSQQASDHRPTRQLGSAEYAHTQFEILASSPCWRCPEIRPWICSWRRIRSNLWSTVCHTAKSHVSYFWHK
jgi:hypothetical protein